MRTFLFSCALLLAVAVSSASPPAGAAPLQADQVKGPRSLLPYLSMLPDPEGNIGIADASSGEMAGSFIPLSGGIPLKGSGPVWLELTVDRPRDFAPAARQALALRFGRLPGGRAEIFFSEAPGPVSADDLWHGEDIVSHEDVTLPEPGLAPIRVFLRLAETPDPWFAPVIGPAGALAPPFLPSDLLLPGLLLAAAAACLLRFAAERRQWAFWSALFLCCALAQTVLPLPGTAGGFALEALPALIAPGLALILLPHVGRCLFRTDRDSPVQDGLLYLASALGLVLALAPLVPGFAWTIRLFPLWPLLLLPLLPVCIARLSAKKPGSLAFFGACLMPVIGACIALYALRQPGLHPLAAQGGLWGLAVGGLGLALARPSQEEGEAAAPETPSLSLSEADFDGKSQYEAMPPLSVTPLTDENADPGADEGPDGGRPDEDTGAQEEAPLLEMGDAAGEAAEKIVTAVEAHIGENDAAGDAAQNAPASAEKDAPASAEKDAPASAEKDAPAWAEKDAAAWAEKDMAARTAENAPPVTESAPKEPAAAAGEAPAPFEAESAPAWEGAPMKQGAQPPAAEKTVRAAPAAPAARPPKLISLLDEPPAPADEAPPRPALEAAAPENSGRYLFSPHSLVNEVQDIVAPLAKARGLIFSWYIAPTLPALLEGDAPRLRGALSLLLQNAVQATASGAVQLSVRKNPASSEPGDLLFSISDSGLAQRTDAGFFHAWELAARSGGAFNVESSPSGGTRVSFTVRFDPASPGAADGPARRALDLDAPDAALVSLPPLEEEKIAAPEPAPTAAALFAALPATPPPAGPAAFEDERFASMSPEEVLADQGFLEPLPVESLPAPAEEEPLPARIVVGESTSGNRRLLAAYLEGLPHELINAESNAGILELSRGRPLDLVIFDADATEDDLAAHITAVRKEEEDLRLPRTPVLVLTSHASQAARMLEAGATSTLRKPFQRTSLRDMVALAVPALAAALGPMPETDVEEPPAILPEGEDRLIRLEPEAGDLLPETEDAPFAPEADGSAGAPESADLLPPPDAPGIAPDITAELAPELAAESAPDMTPASMPDIAPGMTADAPPASAPDERAQETIAAGGPVPEMAAAPWPSEAGERPAPEDAPAENAPALQTPEKEGPPDAAGPHAGTGEREAPALAEAPADEASVFFHTSQAARTDRTMEDAPPASGEAPQTPPPAVEDRPDTAPDIRQAGAAPDVTPNGAPSFAPNAVPDGADDGVAKKIFSFPSLASLAEQGVDILAMAWSKADTPHSGKPVEVTLPPRHGLASPEDGDERPLAEGPDSAGTAAAGAAPGSAPPVEMRENLRVIRLAADAPPAPQAPVEDGGAAGAEAAEAPLPDGGADGAMLGEAEMEALFPRRAEAAHDGAAPESGAAQENAASRTDGKAAPFILGLSPEDVRPPDAGAGEAVAESPARAAPAPQETHEPGFTAEAPGFEAEEAAVVPDAFPASPPEAAADAPDDENDAAAAPTGGELLDFMLPDEDAPPPAGAAEAGSLLDFVLPDEEVPPDEAPVRDAAPAPDEEPLELSAAFIAPRPAAAPAFAPESASGPEADKKPAAAAAPEPQSPAQDRQQDGVMPDDADDAPDADDTEYADDMAAPDDADDMADGADAGYADAPADEDFSAPASFLAPPQPDAPAGRQAEDGPDEPLNASPGAAGSATDGDESMLLPLPGIEGEYLESISLPLLPGLILALRDAIQDAVAGRAAGKSILVQEASSRLAGRAEHFGLVRLGKIARCVERAAEADDMEAVDTLLEDLEPVTERYAAALEESFQTFLDFDR